MNLLMYQDCTSPTCFILEENRSRLSVKGKMHLAAAVIMFHKKCKKVAADHKVALRTLERYVLKAKQGKVFYPHEGRPKFLDEVSLISLAAFKRNWNGIANDILLAQMIEECRNTAERQGYSNFDHIPVVFSDRTFQRYLRVLNDMI